jgi:inhibitor of cysteine peptidase
VRVFSDPGKPVEMTAGGKFVLVLDSNRTTGYHWERSAPEDTAIVKFTGTEYREPETALIGAGGKEVLSFEAAGKGTTDISLKYVRPWEKDVPPAKTVTFRVTVK